MAAARIGRTFGQDPVALLAAPPEDWCIRVASHNVVERDERKRSSKGG
ncbi:MAG TPA: hypothetical protein VFX80_10730 [Solirubrobacteraceae bacterium]|nr:hypothetical protein [Solirubrobacteraceae bacterium]